MAWDAVLVRFGEIGIKSAPVRRSMQRQLRENLEDALLREGVEGGVNAAGSRVLLEGADPERLARVATHVFGVVSASPVTRCESTMEAIGDAAAALALEREWESFAIRARREGKHEFSSQDVQVQVGSRVFTAAQAAGRPVRVDLTNPDFTVNIEVRNRTTYLFTERIAGPGGLPVGTQGKVAALLSDEASFVAAWLMLRRGCAVVPIHAGHSGSLPLEGFEALAGWGLNQTAELLPVCTGTVSKAVLVATAREIARERRCAAVVTGDTLDSDLAVPAADIPLLRPVCGLDPEEYERLRTQIGVPEFDCEDILDADAQETVETLLSMRRRVDA